MSRSVWIEVMESSYDKVKSCYCDTDRNGQVLYYQTVPMLTLVLTGIFYYCSYIWASQLNQRSIPYGSLVRVLGQIHQRFLLCYVKSLHTCRSWWIGNEEARRYHSGLCADTVKPFLTCPWDLLLSFIKFFSGEKTKFPVMGVLQGIILYFSEMCKM